MIDFARLREQMVETQLIPRGIKDVRVLDAMRTIPRHLFVPRVMQQHAYEDRPLPIGKQQTISQPFIVAYMAEAASVPAEGARVLELGTGSGYGAAILSCLAEHVETVEIIEEHANHARDVLDAVGIDNVHVHHADGMYGWESGGPYDAIVVTAAPIFVPPMLKEQLAVGGRMVIPVGDARDMKMLLITRSTEGFEERATFAVRFVPMTGAISEGNTNGFLG
ncbi:MAG: protein-L-isoaspartate O-methyltransferase [Deltaproteobacteria bacterium]|nr:protein-L-isoaspartate O-methyltransferase [Deltaproteobacteria bacterium]MBU47379.1 protein-L-isoaspartate O-methyltransferase [Deltaproteobacteria bacterium]